jgi:hypothetical protein
MQAAQPVLKNTGGRKDPTPRVHAGSHSQCLVAPQTFFPVWLRIPPAPPRGVSVPVILAA